MLTLPGTDCFMDAVVVTEGYAQALCTRFGWEVTSNAFGMKNTVGGKAKNQTESRHVSEVRLCV